MNNDTYKEIESKAKEYEHREGDGMMSLFYAIELAKFAFDKAIKMERERMLAEMFKIAQDNAENYSGAKYMGNNFVMDFINDYRNITAQEKNI